MIYFEFTISRHMQMNESEFDLPTAEFMFDSDNPAECTRQAAVLLRSWGWRPVAVKEACEGFRLEDFHLSKSVVTLFREAQVSGIGFCLNNTQPAALVSQAV